MEGAAEGAEERGAAERGAERLMPARGAVVARGGAREEGPVGWAWAAEEKRGREAVGERGATTTG